MTFFFSRLKRRYSLGKAIPFEKGLHLNKEGGPAAPISIDDLGDWEISWRGGFPQILLAPNTRWEQDTKDTRKFLNMTRDRGGANMGTLPDDPLGPLDKLTYTNRDVGLTEENIKAMTYISRLASVLAKTALTFQDMIKIVKGIFPELVMKFPKPPTYVWNPKSEEPTPPAPAPDDKGDKEKAPEPEPEAEDENTEKLKPQMIKDKLKVKLPQLTWTMRMADGVEQAELGFDDGATAMFEIGAKANHLTITYTAPTREIPPPAKAGDKEEEGQSDADWRAE